VITEAMPAAFSAAGIAVWGKTARNDGTDCFFPFLVLRFERKKRGESMQILKSSEDYLETMLMMRERHGYIRSIDIAAELSVTKPSVSYATKRLRENGYITMDRDGLITLTDKGLAIAEQVYDRHKTLAAFLIQLGVDERTAAADACKIEHDVSDATFTAIRNQVHDKKKP